MILNGGRLRPFARCERQHASAGEDERDARAIHIRDECPVRCGEIEHRHRAVRIVPHHKFARDGAAVRLIDPEPRLRFGKHGICRRLCRRKNASAALFAHRPLGGKREHERQIGLFGFLHEIEGNLSRGERTQKAQQIRPFCARMRVQRRKTLRVAHGCDAHIVLTPRETRRPPRIVEKRTHLAVPGLAPSHGDVLAFLFQKGEAAMHEIAEFAHRTRPTMTVLVDKLSAQGLVVRERSAADTRRVIVRLTESGEALRAAFKAISRRYLATFYDGLAPDEAETLEKLLEKVLANQEKQKGKTR